MAKNNNAIGVSNKSVGTRNNSNRQQDNTNENKIFTILGKRNYRGYETDFKNDESSIKRAKTIVRAKANSAIETSLSNIDNIDTLKTYAIALRTDLLDHMDQLVKEKENNLKNGSQLQEIKKLLVQQTELQRLNDLTSHFINLKDNDKNIFKTIFLKLPFASSEEVITSKVAHAKDQVPYTSVFGRLVIEETLNSFFKKNPDLTKQRDRYEDTTFLEKFWCQAEVVTRACCTLNQLRNSFTHSVRNILSSSMLPSGNYDTKNYDIKNFDIENDENFVAILYAGLIYGTSNRTSFHIMMDLYAHVFLTAYYKKVNNTIKTTKNHKILTEGKRYLHNKNLKSLLTISQEALINITARQWIGKYMQNLHGDKCFDDFKNMLEKVFDANNILPDSRNINLYSNFIEHGRDGFRTWEIQMYLQLCRSIKTQRDNDEEGLYIFDYSDSLPDDINANQAGNVSAENFTQNNNSNRNEESMSMDILEDDNVFDFKSILKN